MERGPALPAGRGGAAATEPERRARCSGGWRRSALPAAFARLPARGRGRAELGELRPEPPQNKGAGGAVTSPPGPPPHSRLPAEPAPLPSPGNPRGPRARSHPPRWGRTAPRSAAGRGLLLSPRHPRQTPAPRRCSGAPAAARDGGGQRPPGPGGGGQGVAVPALPGSRPPRPREVRSCRRRSLRGARSLPAPPGQGGRRGAPGAPGWRRMEGAKLRARPGPRCCRGGGGPGGARGRGWRCPRDAAAPARPAERPTCAGPAAAPPPAPPPPPPRGPGLSAPRRRDTAPRRGRGSGSGAGRGA